MKSINIILVVCLCSIFISACSRQPSNSPEQQALSRGVNELILPWHQNFAHASQVLQESSERFCQNPSNRGEFDAARDAWQQAMMAWQDLQIINFGPVKKGNQAWRLQFWPDSHNRIAQKVDNLLGQSDPISAASLAEANVLLQGLSAMEYMLFDPKKAQLETFENPRACAYLMAASENTHNIATALYNAWQSDAGNYVGSRFNGSCGI